MSEPVIQTTATDPTLVKDQVSSLLIQPLEAASVVLSSGVRIFDSSEPLKLPRLVSGTEPGYVAEGGLIPDTHDVEFGEISLMPTSRKGIKSILRFTNELVRAAHIGLDSVLKQRLIKDVSDFLDSELLSGAGTDNGITGIINQTGVQTGDLDVTDPDSLLDALALATAAEVTPNRWFLSGADFIALRKVKESSTSSKYLLESDLTRDATYRLFGIPVTVTNKLATGTAVLADTSQIAVVRDLNPSVTVLSERWAEYDEVGLRVVCRYDLGLLHPEGVIVLSAV
ncbi:phage major capsid protein [Ammonicoccus fulvus]|uniref:Phage major capsid protein n=1 Tax=Ammonicoccus fulvus TaxID=3138240 RepID=A0ABZ3FQT3_9ACTN